MKVFNLSYRHHIKASYFFQDLSFALEKGKLHALHGRNGTGKSVLLHLLSGSSPKEAHMEGQIIRDGPVVLVNQKFDSMIADQFSFDENLSFACMGRVPSVHRGLITPQIELDCLERFHIDRSTPVHKLSGGQRQILSLLMVLQKPVDVLLLDEPTATLDEENADLVFEFLTLLQQRGMTLLVVCHDKDLIHRFVSGSHLHLEKTAHGLRTIANL
jgi:ABC-type multidrug transport system ATPase subunit